MTPELETQPSPPNTLLGRWRRAGLMAPAIAVVVALALLCGLGSWQLQRKAWKEALLAAIAERSTQAPIDIGDAIFADGAQETLPYTHVRVTGRFLHDKERYWFADGRLGSGFDVFTPLEVGAGKIVWVNRGYVPATKRDPSTRAQAQIPGTATVAGLIRSGGERNAFTPPNDVAGNVWFWRDIAGLTTSAFAPGVTTAPVMIDVDAGPANPGGWPEGGTTIVTLPNRHLEYAVTWYGLALTLIGVFFAFCRARLRRDPE